MDLDEAKESRLRVEIGGYIILDGNKKISTQLCPYNIC
jgi:hypothetical protein